MTTKSFKSMAGNGVSGFCYDMLLLHRRQQYLEQKQALEDQIAAARAVKKETSDG